MLELVSVRESHDGPGMKLTMKSVLRRVLPALGGPESNASRHPGMPRPRGWAVRVPRWRDAAAEPTHRATTARRLHTNTD